MRNTRAYSAIREPILPRPNSPSVRPARLMPTVLCHAPSCMRRLSRLRWRTVAIISPHVSSGVASTMLAKSGLAKFECETITPCSVAAAMSRLGKSSPTIVISLRFGNRSNRLRGSLILGEMLLENCYLGLAVERRPVSQLKRNLRVVIEDSNLDHFFGPPLFD